MWVKDDLTCVCTSLTHDVISGNPWQDLWQDEPQVDEVDDLENDSQMLKTDPETSMSLSNASISGAAVGSTAVVLVVEVLDVDIVE